MNNSHKGRVRIKRALACAVAFALVLGCDNTPRYFTYENPEFGFTVDLPEELKDQVKMTQEVKQLPPNGLRVYKYLAQAPQMTFGITATVKPPFYEGRPFVVDAFQEVRKIVEQNGYSIQSEKQIEIRGRAAPLLRCKGGEGLYGDYAIVEIGNVIFELSILTPAERFLDIPHAKHFFDSFDYVAPGQ